MAAEAAIFGDRSIGSGGNVDSDIERATTVARRMVGTYELGKTPTFLGTPRELGDGPLPERMEAEVSDIVAGQWERVLAMLKKEHDRVFALAVDVVTYVTLRIETASQPRVSPGRDLKDSNVSPCRLREATLRVAR